MRKHNIIAVCAALLIVSSGSPNSLRAAPPPSLRGPIALVGGIRIEEADIQRAALVLAADPLRVQHPAQWRKKLLDFCIDRELLAMEAERQGLLRDPNVMSEIVGRNEEALNSEIRDRVLIPALEPTPAQIDTARAGHGFRRINARYMLTVSDRKSSIQFCSALRRGASFDSIARIYSIHPSAADGGRVGWVQIRYMNPISRSDVEAAKPGDVLGPYPNDAATEVYRVDSIAEPTATEIRDALMRDRSRGLDAVYQAELLRKYKFTLDPTQVNPVIFAAATERVDSILVSLGPDGTRSARGVHPALGTLARVDGDSITYADIAKSAYLVRESDGKAHIEDTQRLYDLCVIALLPRLVPRDAHDRGVDRIPDVARKLRLIREEASTRAMVARAAPARSDSASLSAYLESHRERFQRPPARRSVVAIFIKEDSARAARYFWSGIASFDSSLIAKRFLLQERASVSTLLAGYHAEIPLFETDTDPVSLAARSLSAGQLSQVVQMPHGFALALVLGKEPARPLTLAEAAARVAQDLRDDRQDAWVVSELKRLRVATPAQRFPARLEALRISAAPSAGRKRR